MDLMLYHVSNPEPRARWVFNQSKRGNVVDNGPPPETITSITDKRRPNLGGIVWINAVLGKLHCCLQKGLKNKAVTPVPTEVIDGWLNGQHGLWWIGALKDGHRTLWDSHVVMNWAMIFIPSSPEVAARNNKEVWDDKCLPGTLRMARPGELARKITDIVTDDQDREPEQVVHTHLCILLPEGDDLELKRPKSLTSATPRSSLGSNGSFRRGSDGSVLKQSKSLGTMSVSKATLEKSGSQKMRAGTWDTGGAVATTGDAASGGIVVSGDNMALEEALEKVKRYREKIAILKQDRRTKKDQVEQLRAELEKQEEAFAGETERLKLEKEDSKERAKLVWEDLEKLRRDPDTNALKKKVERLRRERNSARTYVMRWLQQQGASPTQFFSTQSNGSAIDAAGNPDLDASGHEEGDAATDTRSVAPQLGPRTRSAPDPGRGSFEEAPKAAPSTDAAGGPDNTRVQASIDVKTAEAIVKLKAKVERLRRERDEAEAHAADWLRGEQEKLQKVYGAKGIGGGGDGNDEDHGDGDDGHGDDHEDGDKDGCKEVDTADAEIEEEGEDDEKMEESVSTPGHTTSPSQASNTPTSSTVAGDEGGGRITENGGGGGGVVVASLRAESKRLLKELREAREEADRLRKIANANANGPPVSMDSDSGSACGSGSGASHPSGAPTSPPTAPDAIRDTSTSTSTSTANTDAAPDTDTDTDADTNTAGGVHEADPAPSVTKAKAEAEAEAEAPAILEVAPAITVFDSVASAGGVKGLASVFNARHAATSNGRALTTRAE